MIFEGPEKKLEVILDASVDLLSLPDSFWKNVVAKSSAQILSSVETPKQRAYLLSESSLFVFPNRFVMITCGTTTLAKAALEFFKEVSIDRVQAIFFQRKNENFPHLQKSNFFDDIKDLKGLLRGSLERVYQFGESDEHHMFLYHAVREDSVKGPNGVSSQEDLTLEVLMHGIQGEARSVFLESGQNMNRVESTGITRIFDNFQVDQFLFEPFGYSMNAVRESSYYTFHVTPQDLGSYVSFETNHLLKTQEQILAAIKKVVSLFQPRSFDVIFFHSGLQSTGPIEIAGRNYVCIRRVREELPSGYSAEFTHFSEVKDQEITSAKVLEME